MPFAVFRRHQRKMIAVFGILAMIAFVLSDYLGRTASSRSGRGGNPVVVDLYGKPVHKSDLDQFAQLRSVANRFIMPVKGDQTYFGAYKTRDLIDALILRHEADRLGIPETTDFARAWLKRETFGRMNRLDFESFLKGVGEDVSGEQVLAALASQIRLLEARRLLGGPIITPLDVYQAYRDQNERATFRVVSFPAANFLDKVGEPSLTEVQSLYETYKDVLPDPKKDTPGFKIPREVKLEVLSIDGNDVGKKIQEKLAEAEVKTYYESRKTEFAKPSELPFDVFKDDPTAALTPPQFIPFAEVKDLLVAALAREKAQEQVADMLDKIKDDLDAFSDKYNTALDEINEAKKSGQSAQVALPIPTSLTDIAKAKGLTHEVTPLLSNEEAATYGRLGGASVGVNPLQPGETKFAAAVFAPKSPLFDGIEFSEPSGLRFLVRKLEDVPAHVGPLDVVRPDVIAAWKLGKARILAEAAARDLAEKIKKDGGKIKDEIVNGRPVITIESKSKLSPGMPIPTASGLQYGPPTLTDLPQIPNLTDDFRDKLFALKTGDVLVASDAPKKAYYVSSLERREPASFAGLYGPAGGSGPYFGDAFRKTLIETDKERMDTLRAAAGIKPDWVPSDEKTDRDEQPAE